MFSLLGFEKGDERGWGQDYDILFFRQQYQQATWMGSEGEFQMLKTKKGVFFKSL